MEAVQIFGPVKDSHEEMRRLQDAMNKWLSENDGIIEFVAFKFGYSHDKITAAVFYRRKRSNH